MTIAFHEEFRKRLVREITGILSKAEIRSNSFLVLDYDKLDILDRELERNNKANWQSTICHVSESPLSDFVVELLSEEIERNRKYDSSVGSFPLSDLDEYKESTLLADRILRELETLPREYKLFIQLPIYQLSEIILKRRIQVSEELSLVRPDAAHQETFLPPTYKAPRLPGWFLFTQGETDPELHWMDHNFYFEISAKGFIGSYADTSPLKRASDLVRSFCGLALVLQLLEVRHTWLKSEAYMQVYERKQIDWFSKKTRTLPTELTHGLNNLALHLNFQPTESLIRTRPTTILRQLSGLFSHWSQNERLLSAAQWHFDSYCGDNELLSFVKSTICLEMLLVDKELSDLIGIMETLRNRCAYFIGKDPLDRKQILEDIREIYATRSSIVHRGHDRLTKAERRSLFRLRALCARVMYREIAFAGH